MIFITGANGWLGLNLVNAIISGKTVKWGLDKDDITGLILTGTSKEKLLRSNSTLPLILILQFPNEQRYRTGYFFHVVVLLTNECYNLYKKCWVSCSVLSFSKRWGSSKNKTKIAPKSAHSR